MSLTDLALSGPLMVTFLLALMAGAVSFASATAHPTRRLRLRLLDMR